MDSINKAWHQFLGEQSGHTYVGAAVLILPAAVLFAFGIVNDSKAFTLIGGLIGFAVMLIILFALHHEGVSLEGRIDRLEAAAPSLKRSAERR